MIVCGLDGTEHAAVLIDEGLSSQGYAGLRLDRESCAQRRADWRHGSAWAHQRQSRLAVFSRPLVVEAYLVLKTSQTPALLPALLNLIRMASFAACKSAVSMRGFTPRTTGRPAVPHLCNRLSIVARVASPDIAGPPGDGLEWEVSRLARFAHPGEDKSSFR